MKIVIAIDQSEASWDAALFAGALLPPDTEVTMVNVVANLDPVLVSAGGLVGLPAAGSLPGDDRADVLAALRPAAAAAGADEVVIEEGDVVERIASVVAERSADLVIVGSRDRSGLAALLTRSVSRRLLDELAVPVLVVQ